MAMTMAKLYMARPERSSPAGGDGRIGGGGGRGGEETDPDDSTIRRRLILLIIESRKHDPIRHRHLPEWPFSFHPRPPQAAARHVDDDRDIAAFGFMDGPLVA